MTTAFVVFIYAVVVIVHTRKNSTEDDTIVNNKFRGLRAREES